MWLERQKFCVHRTFHGLSVCFCLSVSPSVCLPPPGCPEPPGLASVSPGAPLQPPDLLYADGLRAYAARAWAPAVALLREALRGRAVLGRARRDCGAHCAAEAGSGTPATLHPDPGRAAWEPLLLRSALRRAECLTQCGVQKLGPGGAARFRMGSSLRAAFRRREPYNYLQRAYYQVVCGCPRGPRAFPALLHHSKCTGETLRACKLRAG